MRKPSANTKQDLFFLQRKCLYLRYGSEAPIKIPRARPILPMNVVSSMLKEPVDRLYWFARKYFNEDKQKARQ